MDLVPLANFLLKITKLDEGIGERNIDWEYSDQENWKKYVGYYGVTRSPINILTNNTINVNVKLKFHYLDEIRGNFTIDTHSIYFRPEELNCYIELNEKKYYLNQIHCHNSSENRINNLIAPCEFHFVHSTIDGKILVLGLLVNVTNNVEKIIPFSRTYFNCKNNENSFLNLSYLNKLIKSKIYYFVGSLTTPPFLPLNVKWLVISYTQSKRKLNILEDDYLRFVSMFPNNKSNEISYYNSNRYTETHSFISVYKLKI